MRALWASNYSLYSVQGNLIRILESVFQIVRAFYLVGMDSTKMFSKRLLILKEAIMILAGKVFIVKGPRKWGKCRLLPEVINLDSTKITR